jgi:hypothetical protein
MATTHAKFIWDTIRVHLENKINSLVKEMRNYPTPVSGCDAQFNYLFEQRNKILRELSEINIAYSQNTPHVESIHLMEKFITASGFIDTETDEAIRVQLSEILS